MSTDPNVIVLAGPNGAGKSTAAPRLLRGTLAVHEFVNADVIAQGLSAFNPEGAALAAGRIMLARLQQLARERVNFAFETTLANRTFAPWLKELVVSGYRFRLVYMWVPGADMSVDRVARRVDLGGHFVPEETIRRRYERGLSNFFNLYQPFTSTWRMYDNSQHGPRLIAMGRGTVERLVKNHSLWQQLKREYRHEP
jgi:predicted ABC-type ATPase